MFSLFILDILTVTETTVHARRCIINAGLYPSVSRMETYLNHMFDYFLVIKKKRNKQTSYQLNYGEVHVHKR